LKTKRNNIQAGLRRRSNDLTRADELSQCSKADHETGLVSQEPSLWLRVLCWCRASPRLTHPVGPDPSTGQGRSFGACAVAKTDLSDIYRSYIACLNAQDWTNLGQFVATSVCHNDRQIGLSGYRAMLEQDFREIPDLHFNIELLISDPPYVASRLAFDCAPRARFLGLDVNGRRVTFAENVVYAFQEHKIVRVWSVIDKAAIERQLQA
jgi:predicted ester cyclase